MVEGFGRSEAAKAAWVQRRLGLKNYPSPKMQIRGILEAEKVFTSPQDAQAAAALINEGLNSYRLPPSVFSGKILHRDLSVKYLGRAEWNGDVSLRLDGKVDTIIHELLHMRSAVREAPRIYDRNSRIEEAVVQLLTQEISREHGISPVPSLYDPSVEKLRYINSVTHTGKNDFEFGITLINVPLKDRYDWLVDEVEDCISKQKPDGYTCQMLRDSYHFLFGGASF